MTRATTPTVNVPINHGEKSEKFNGLNFKRWQQKMLFYLTTLNFARFLTEDAPKLNEEHGQSSKENKNKFVKGPKLGPKGGVSKKKFLEKYYNCDKVGHKSSKCTLPKRNNKKETNIVDDITHDVYEMSLVAVISEANLVGSNSKEWWIDTGTTHRVCSDKEMFSSFEAAENGEKLFMENSATSKIKGQGKVVLKMTSRK
ncbi:Retrovirus-related Pol polyprotein from transposon TNT 1-94 [Abeliophyllum distichum]|uniref:Retrovirus-related Pol polyprotein from transposon TNT 1-94 n=1 Tax=Abeliophyllum distichum TaxID=126358 RepID=A0ABD1NSE7_9LAMI